MTICFDLHVQMAATYPTNIVVLPIVFGALAGRGDAARRALRGVAFRAPEAAHAAPGVRERRTALAVAKRAPLVGRVPLRDWQRARRRFQYGTTSVRERLRHCGLRPRSVYRHCRPQQYCTRAEIAFPAAVKARARRSFTIGRRKGIRKTKWKGLDYDIRGTRQAPQFR
jgi:hypothetical protein